MLNFELHRGQAGLCCWLWVFGMERVYFGAGQLLSSWSRFGSVQRGLGFRRVGPRILEAAQASEIGGVQGCRRSIEV